MSVITHWKKHMSTKIGNTVKVEFVTGLDVPAAELMWVEITGKRGDRWVGKLRNVPQCIDLKYGDTVTFREADILERRQID